MIVCVAPEDPESEPDDEPLLLDELGVYVANGLPNEAMHSIQTRQDV